MPAAATARAQEPAVPSPVLSTMRLSTLREAIHHNRVSFPDAVPVFAQQNRPDIQWRIVELYFVRGWSCRQLAGRYGVCPSRIRQLLHGWVDRATTLGYLQAIPGEAAIPCESSARIEDQELSSWRPSEPTWNSYIEHAGAAI